MNEIVMNASVSLLGLRCVAGRKLRCVELMLKSKMKLLRSKKKNDIKISYPKASNQIIGSVISTKANLNYDLGQSI